MTASPATRPARAHFAFVAALGLGALSSLGCTSSAEGLLGSGLIAPELVDLGAVALGDVAEVEVELGNASTQTLRISSVVAAVDFSTDGYAFGLSGVPRELPANGAASLLVRFEAFQETPAPVESSFVVTTELGARELRVRAWGRRPLAIEPASLDFGAVARGTTAELELTATNRTERPLFLTTPLEGQVLALEERRGEGTFELLPQVSTAGDLPGASPLAPGASTTFRVRYRPEVAPRSPVADRGVLAVRYCPRPACSVGVPLLGEGSDAALTCTPGSLEFGAVEPGRGRDLTVRCTAAAGAPVTIEAVEILPADLGFESRTGTPIVLAAGESADLTIRASPPEEARGRDLVAIARVEGWMPETGRALEAPELELRVSSGLAELSVAPEALSFGRVALGTERTLRVQVTNAGSRALTVAPEALGARELTASGQGQLQPGESLVVSVTFQPTAPGRVTALLAIAAAGGDPQATVQLTGEGVDLPPCEYAISDVELDFGDVLIGRSVEREVVLDNVGAHDCVVHAPDVAELGEGLVLHTDALGEHTLAPGERLVLPVTYFAEVQRESRAPLSLYVSAPSSGPEVFLRGRGSELAPVVSPERLDFGDVSTSCGALEKRIKLLNLGPARFAVGDVELIQAPAGVFALEGAPSAGQTLEPGAKLTFDVRFTPAPGDHRGRVVITSADGAHTLVVALTGAASPAPGAINRERFVQGSAAIDVLFVVQRESGAFVDPDGFASTFSSLTGVADASGVDYQLAAIAGTTSLPFDLPCPSSRERPEGTPPGACGYLSDGSTSEARGAWRIITRDEQPTASEAFTRVLEDDTPPGAPYQAFDAVNLAFSPPLLQGWGAGLLRRDAHLAVVFVSTFDDLSSIAVEDALDAIESLEGKRHRERLTISAIAGDWPGGCQGESFVHAAPRLFEATRATGGTFHSACTFDWRETSEALGAALFGYRPTLRLAGDPEATSLELRVDGALLPREGSSGHPAWTYDAATRAIHFSPLVTPAPGAEIEVAYVVSCP